MLCGLIIVWETSISYTEESTDGGANFGGTVNLSNTTGSSSSPAVAVSVQNVYVVWIDNSLGNFDILFRKSTDGGANFGGTVNLSNTTVNSGSPRVAASSNLSL